MQKWKAHQGHEATYRKLLKLFVDANDAQCIEAVCNVLKSRLHIAPTGGFHPLNPHEQANAAVREYNTYFILVLFGIIVLIIAILAGVFLPFY